MDIKILEKWQTYKKRLAGELFEILPCPNSCDYCLKDMDKPCSEPGLRAARYCCQNPLKIRPAMFSAYLLDALTDNKDILDNFYKAAYAFDFLYNAAHIQDDLMDKSELRESRPCTYLLFGRDYTILAGNLLLFKSFEFFIDFAESAKLPEEIRSKFLHMMNYGYLISQGNYRDIANRGKITDLKTYEEVVVNQVGVLMQGVIELPFILTGKDFPEEVAELSRNFGILAHILDDYLDVYGFEKELDRPQASDLKMDSANLFTCLLYQKVGKQDYPELDLIYKALEEHNIKSEALEVIRNYIQKSKQLALAIEDINLRKVLLKILSIFMDVESMLCTNLLIRGI